MGNARAITAETAGGRTLLGLLVAVPLALLGGALAVISAQAAVTLAFLVLLLAVRTQSRMAGLTLLWTYWLLAPLVRRTLDLAVAAPGADPISLLPFLGTAALAVMELRENRLTRRARWILAFAGTGMLIGVPMGMLEDPEAASFALLAYGAAVSAFVIGWGDGVRPEQGSTLHRTLLAALIPLSAYAIVQYFLPLPSWDAHWVNQDEGLGSLNAPQEGKIRIFSSLNSPFTFAIVLATGILLGLGLKRRFRQAALFLAPLIVALALTYMRSVWLGLVVGLLVFAFAARGRARGRVIAIVVACFVAVLVVGDSNPTTRAFTERVTSLGDPEKDVSFQDRLERTNQLLPESLSKPLGAGSGQAGLASERLGGTTDEFLVNVDNGYLSLLYQSGPFGFLLTVAALFAALGSAVRALGIADEERRQERAALLATLVMLLVALAAADVLFGLPGAILWYVCGLAVAYARREPTPSRLGYPSAPRSG
jgi:putative inorganic carbon (hco3(-)) transporter